MGFEIKINFDGIPIAKSKKRNLSDFDDLFNGLKDKFGERRKK